MKKITILKTNNDASLLLKNELVFKNESIAYLKELYGYISDHGFKLENQSEFSDIKKSLAWVTSQWSHDGMNEPQLGAKALDILKSVYMDKKQYRCVEYGIVLSDVLQAIGLESRIVALRSTNVAYGGLGQGHVAMEVWSNELRKWIFLDPQFGVFLTKKNSELPLSFYEAFKEKKKKQWDLIVVNSVKDKIKLKEQNGYKNFLKNYFGHMTVNSGNDQPKISLRMEEKNTPITFQAQPANNIIFTDDSKLIYPQMNTTSILLSYDGEQPNYQAVLSRLKIQTEADYLKNMDHFAAIPNYVVSLKTNTPRLKGFEYRFNKNEEWKFINENKFKWNASNPLNYLEVRSVNELEKTGPSTFIELSYK